MILCYYSMYKRHSMRVQLTTYREDDHSLKTQENNYKIHNYS